MTEDGRIVGFDPADDMLRVYNPEGTELQAEVPILDPFGDDQTFLVAIGPDDVAYFQTYPPTAIDSQAELVALPLVGSNAGSVVMRWTGVSGNGDQTLIARKTGLTSVGCCGPRVARPAPDDTIYRWVDRNGEVIESIAPSFDLNLGDAGNSLTRIDTGADGEPAFTPFTLPTAFEYPRDFPRVVPADDGGALAADVVQRGGQYQVFVDFDTDWPANRVDNSDVFYATTDGSSGMLEPAGTVLVVDGDGFVRRSLDQVATRGWPGSIKVVATPEITTIEADGLNDYVDAEQPFWAGDPELFGLQFKQSLGPNEQVTVEYDAESTTLTVMITGFLDDSVEGETYSIDVDVANDGLFRFVSGSVSQICRPGREPGPASESGFCI